MFPPLFSHCHSLLLKTAVSLSLCTWSRSVLFLFSVLPLHWAPCTQENDTACRRRETERKAERGAKRGRERNRWGRGWFVYDGSGLCKTWRSAQEIQQMHILLQTCILTAVKFSHYCHRLFPLNLVVMFYNRGVRLESFWNIDSLCKLCLCAWNATKACGRESARLRSNH